MTETKGQFWSVEQVAVRIRVNVNLMPPPWMGCSFGPVMPSPQRWRCETCGLDYYTNVYTCPVTRIEAPQETP